MTMLTRLLIRRLLRWVADYLTAAANLYCLGVCLWAVSHPFLADRWWWLFVLNTLAVYLFFPLPLVLALALLVRRRALWLGCSLTFFFGVYFYGELLLPRRPPRPASPDTVLTVMTYNVFGYNERATGVVDALRASNADVIALQELNPLVAEAIRADLPGEYPYQVLAPQPGTAGMGVVSRHPLSQVEATLPGDWVGAPQVVDLTFEHTSITLINFHAVPPLDLLELGEGSIRERERQMRTLASFVESQPGPVIVLGDLNAADRNAAYGIISRDLVDAWRAAGRGLGNTFPGFNSKVPGMPMWLVRIDYIFHSDDWQTLSIRIGPWDGHSDHRPVVARVALSPEWGAEALQKE